MSEGEKSQSTQNNDEGITSYNNDSIPRKKLSFISEVNKKYKKGIVYLSFIPPGMNVQILTQILCKYGKLGRIMLQTADHKSVSDVVKKKNKKRNFSEGWVEFLKKKIAKQVAAGLNNTQIGGKKKSKYHDYIWNIKYLSRFKWVHLSERIGYERAVYKQRMQTEINQAKKVASHFIDKVEAAERQERFANKKKKINEEEKNEGEKEWLLSTFFKQRETEQEKIAKREKKHKKNENREVFLKNIFS